MPCGRPKMNVLESRRRSSVIVSMKKTVKRRRTKPRRQKNRRKLFRKHLMAIRQKSKERPASQMRRFPQSYLHLTLNLRSPLYTWKIALLQTLNAYNHLKNLARRTVWTSTQYQVIVMQGKCTTGTVM